MGGAPFEGNVLGCKSIVGAKDRDGAVIAKARVHGDHHVHSLKGAPVQKFGLAPKEMKPAFLDFLQPPLCFQTLLCRNTGHYHLPAKLLQHSAFRQREKCAHGRGHLDRVAACMGSPCPGIAVRVGITDQGIHFPHDHDTGTWASRVIGTGKTGHIRPGSCLKAVIFQNLQAVFLCFIFLKTSLRMIPKPITVSFDLRKLRLQFISQLLKPCLIQFSHFISSSL